MTYITTTDRAAQIRADLKRLGITSRQVSVKADYYSMGSSINVRIKDATVPMSIVKAAAERHESINRCEFSGEILSGGNRFVFVDYDARARQDIGNLYIDAVKAAAAQVTDNYLIDVAGLRNCRIGRHGSAWSLWGTDGHITECYDLETVSQIIGRMAKDGAVSRA